MLDGVALESVAAPPESDNVKSEVWIAPLPPVVLYIGSEKVTSILALVEETLVDIIVGAVRSNKLIVLLDCEVDARNYYFSFFIPPH